MQINKPTVPDRLKSLDKIYATLSSAVHWRNHRSF